jgi:hypothetical protein
VKQADRDPRLATNAFHRQYLTDGVNLFRFVGWLGRSMGEKLAELEDCRSLDILLVPQHELERAALQWVR